jgi:hypothetical protein
MFKIAPCSHEAAKFAVMNWHYSQAMPVGKLIYHGIWENEKFIGAIIYGRGANHRLGEPYNLTQIECCELVKVALSSHLAPVSQMLSESLKILKKTNPGLRLVISYADTKQGHKGGIYQATNWIYTGQSQTTREWFIDGKWVHNRIGSSHPKRNPKNTREGSKKHTYIMPLDKAMRRKVATMAKDYPSAVEGSKVSRVSSSGEV